MRVTLQAKLLKSVFSTVKSVVTSGRLQFLGDRIEFGEINSARTVYVCFQIDSACCEEYQVEENVIGINIDSFCRLLQMASEHDQVTLSDKSDCLIFSIRGSRQLDFEIRLIQVDDELLSFSGDYNSWARIASSEFKSTCKTFAELGDSVTIGLHKDRITFILADLAQRTYSLGEGGHLVELHCQEPVGIEISLGLLLKFQCDDHMIVAIDEARPLRLHWENYGCKIDLFIAARSD